MLNILYLINYAGKAGTEKYVYNLAKTFDGKKAKCFFAYNEEGLLSEQIKELKIPCVKIPMKGPFDLAAAKKISDYCNENNIDVIHTQYPRENYIAILSKLFGCRARVIYTCHLTYYPPKIWNFTNKIMMRHDDRIIAVCNCGKRILCEIGAPENKIDVIFNGIDTPQRGEKNDKIKKELGLREDTFVITTLARHNKEKGLPYLVRSMKRLSEKTDMPFACIIAGDGPLFEETKQCIKDCGAENYVFALGFRRDTDDILSGSDIFVNSASGNEALSFAILEAMGHALPVIATDIGGNPDIVNPENSCGELVPYGDEEKMADAVLRMMNDKDYYQKCSDGAFKAVSTVFNLPKLLNDTFKEYIF